MRVSTLRGYQTEFIEDIAAAWGAARAVLAVLPTGAGKTVCFSAIMQRHAGASVAVVHRKEILGQISQSLARLGIPHRVIAPPQTVQRFRRKHLRELGRSYIDPHALAGVASVQTFASSATDRNQDVQRWAQQVTLAVFDEGHHYVKSGTWAKAVGALGAARLLFVTATPERADGKGLGLHEAGFAEVLVEGPPTKWLTEQGYLSAFDYYAPASDLNTSNIPVTASGDLNTRVLRARVLESHLVGDAVAHYQRRCAGKRAIVFATDVATSDEIATAFRRAGIEAVSLNGATEQAERDEALDGFEAGRVQVLVNCDLFDEGFDVPGVAAVILARPTDSLAKFLQQVGRALRPVYAEGYDLTTQAGRLAAIAAGPKPRAVVVDMVRNWERGHGLPNWPRRWSLDGRTSGAGRARDTVLLRTCYECTQPYERFYAACPHCGAAPVVPERSTPEQVDGDLTALDVDALAAVFAAQHRADMDDADYSIDQIRRGIPPIGRAADLRRHQAGRYRRTVLRELVAWWAGAQPPGRPLGEIHRRFYHRFGVDIGAAFTLPASETDKLIDTIQRRFAEDITS